MHVDDRATALEETLQALADFVREGKVRYLGWSTCVPGGWSASGACARPTAGRSRWRCSSRRSYLQRRAGLDEPSIVDAEQLDYLRERADLSLVAYSPLLKGLYDAPAAGRPAHPGMAPYAGDAAARRLAVLDAVAAETGYQPGQVVLAWMAGQRSPRCSAHRDDQGRPLPGGRAGTGPGTHRRAAHGAERRLRTLRPAAYTQFP